MSRLCFSPSSRQDLLGILDFIAADKPGAALQHIDRIEKQCRLLAENPGMGSACAELLPGLRVSSVGNYAIFYRSTGDAVEIVRVVNGARDFTKLFG